MIYKVFLDTNIVIDFFVKERPCHEYAKKVFKMLDENQLYGFISESVITNMAYVLRKYFNPIIVRQIIEDILSLTSLLPANNKLVSNAIKGKISDLEDAILYEIATDNKLHYFISNDLSDFKVVNIKILPVINAAAFLKLLEK
jgi:predicted nucleic acid-binding protein